jgi:capsular exopolysaccharide synthesis family protein
LTTDNNDRPRIDLREITALLVRRWWVILLATVGLVIPTVVLNENAVPVYEATATIVYEPEAGTPAAVVLPNAFFVDNTVTNHMQEIRSLSLAEEVVRSLPPDIFRRLGYPLSTADDEKLRRKLSRSFRDRLTVGTIRDSDVIYLRVRAQDPQAVELIANTYAEVAVRRSDEIKRSQMEGLRAFLIDQIAFAEANLHDTENTLRDFKVHSGVVQVDAHADQVVSALGNAEQAYAQALEQQRAAEARLAYLTARLDSAQLQMIPSVEDVKTPLARQLREELVQREATYATLLARGYDEDHPQLRRERTAIEDLRSRLTDEVSSLVMSNIDDPLDQAANLMVMILEAQVDILMTRVSTTALSEEIEAYENRVAGLPDIEVQLIRLEREKRVAEEIFTMLKTRYEEVRISEAGSMGSLRILDRALAPDGPIRPNKRLNIIVALILGMSIGVGLTFVLDSLDTSIRTAEELERATDVPVIGLIPSIRGADGKSRRRVFRGRRKRRSAWARTESDAKSVATRLVTRYEPKSPTSEAYRTLRTSLRLSRPGRPLKTLLVTSAGPQEGKSTTTANLAITCAQMGTRTLLVDSDLRRPIQHQLFDVDREPGIVEVLFGMEDLDDALRETTIENLSVLPCGAIPPNPSEVMASEQMKKLIATLVKKFDLVLFDSPPVITVSDAVVFSSSVDGVICVAAAGQSERDALVRTRSLLSQVEANLVGTVLNKLPVGNTYGSYGYYSYYYYYYGRDESSDD